MAKVSPAPGPLSETHGHCWIWTGATDGGGRYGRIGDGAGSSVATHRLAYETWVGPIPEGFELDHLCRVTLCCNPSHLEAVPHVVNVHRGASIQARNAAKTHCHRGHELVGSNVRIRKSDGGRICIACERINYANRQAKIRRGEIPRSGGRIGRPKGQPAR
jgi:hypothetical protein